MRDSTMSIYAKNLTAQQLEAMERYEQITGFEPIGQDDFNSGDLSFDDMWRMNIVFIENLYADVTNLNPG